MAAAWNEWQAEVGSQQKPVMPEAWLDRLIAAEQVDRQVRSLNHQLKAARFPIHRDLLQIDWSETPLQKARIEQLATGHFILKRSVWLETIRRSLVETFQSRLTV